jgi:hypothetical protein
MWKVGGEVVKWNIVENINEEFNKFLSIYVSRWIKVIFIWQILFNFSIFQVENALVEKGLVRSFHYGYS